MGHNKHFRNLNFMNDIGLIHRLCMQADFKVLIFHEWLKSMKFMKFGALEKNQLNNYKPWFLFAITLKLWTHSLVLCSCNRFTAQEKAKDTVKKARGDMEAAYVKKATEDLKVHTKRFFHYHERYSNHLHSLDVSRYNISLFSIGKSYVRASHCLVFTV